MTRKTLASTQRRAWRYRAVLAVAVPALVGAVFGAASSLLVIGFQQVSTAEALRTAFASEVEAILVAIRRPARTAAGAWENKRDLKDHTFYYPRAIYDANVGRLGELRDKNLVRDITYMYAMLELAREEVRSMKAGTPDSEGTLRYVTYLISAFAISRSLLPQLNDSFRDLFAVPGDVDQEFIAATVAKLREAALAQPTSVPADRK